MNQMKALAFTASGLLLFAALQAPAIAGPALSTAALHRIEMMLEPVLGSPEDQSAPAAAGATLNEAGLNDLLLSSPLLERPEAARQLRNVLQPLRPGTGGRCAASLMMPGNGQRFWAIYMIGADLESDGAFATTNLNQLVEAWQALGEPANAEVFLAFGGAAKDGWRGMRWATMAQIVADAADGIYGNEVDAAYTLVDPNANMGSAETFASFISYVQTEYGQAGQRFLSFWNHGASYNRTPGIGPDENAREVLDLTRINHVLVDSGSCWHLIGFDACLMASLQSARAIKDAGLYMLASEELEPAHGWNYRETLNAWLTEPDTVAAGRAMVDAFVNTELQPYAADGKTLSLVDLTVYDQVARAMSDAGLRLADVLEGLEGAGAAAVIQAFAKSARYAASFTIDPSIMPSQLSIDAADFLGLIIPRVEAQDPDLAWRLSQTVDHLSAMVVHSLDDGTRPHSHGIATSPLDMNPVNAADQVRVGLITPGWGELVGAWAALQERASEPALPLAVTADVESGGLTFADRWGRPIWDPFATETLGAVGGFQSPYLMDVMAAFGELRQDGSFVVLGEDETDPLIDGSAYFPLWNGLSMHFADDSGVIPVPVFYDEISDTAVGIVGFPNNEEVPGIGLGVLMIEDDFDYSIAPVDEYPAGGLTLGRAIQSPFGAGDEVSFLSLVLAADGTATLEEVGRHVFASEPELRMAPLTGVNPAWAFTGYTVADEGAISSFVEVRPSDRVINWATATNGQMLSGLQFDNLYANGFYGRCNEARDLCIGENNGRMLSWNGVGFSDLGSVEALFQQAEAAGY